MAKRLSRIMTMARKQHLVSYESLTDGLRDDIKPSSWAGILDYTDTVRDVYRKDLWRAQSHYIEFAFEKHAIIGTVEDIGDSYNVKLRPLHGQDSTSHMYRWAKQLSQIKKPIFICYAGDHDASGYTIEDSAQRRLNELLKDEFKWTARDFSRLHWERFAFLSGYRNCCNQAWVLEKSIFLKIGNAQTASCFLSIEQFIGRLLSRNGSGESRLCGCPDFLKVAEEAR